MFYFFTWMISLLFILVKGGLANRAGLDFLDVDVVTVITAYLLGRYGQVGAGLFAFAQGLLIDVYSAGLVGLFTLLYLVAFLGMLFGARFFDPKSPKGIFILVALAVLLKEVSLLIILDLFSYEMILSPSVFLYVAASALSSGLIAPFFCYIFKRLGGAFSNGVEEPV